MKILERYHPCTGNYPIKASGGPLPAFSVFCDCGEKLYELETRLLAYCDDAACPKCKQKYSTRNGLIVTPKVFSGMVDGKPFPARQEGIRSSRSRRRPSGRNA
jgi:hypothetical protein